MREGASFAIWLVLGLMLIVTGFEGSLGKVMACIFAPDIVVINS